MRKLQTIAHDWALGLIDPDALAALPERERRAILRDKDLVWYRDAGESVHGEISDRRVPYVLSAEHAVGRTKDVIIQSGWELDRFKQHGSPLLFMHNLDELRAPIGKLDSLKKNGQTKDGIRALTGIAQYVDEGINPLADMVYAQVDAGFMPAGSVGFYILEARKPKTEQEIEKYGLGEFSYVYARCQLLEFSVVDIPKDPSAVKQRWTPELEGRLLDGVNEGRWSEQEVYVMRGLITGEAEKTSVVVPEIVAGDTSIQGAETVGNEIAPATSAEQPVTAPAVAEPAPQAKRIEDVLAALDDFKAQTLARLDEIEVQLREQAEVAQPDVQRTSPELLFELDDSTFSDEERAFLELVGVTSDTKD